MQKHVTRQAGLYIKAQEAVCACLQVLTVCVLQSLDHVRVQRCADQHLHVAPEHLPHGTVVHATFYWH